jgi:O-antigen ligase
VPPLAADGRRALAWLLLGFAAFSIILSAFQLIGGPGSALRFYAVTNPTRAVGFFASANHLPTLILCALPVAGILAAAAITSRSKQKKSGGLTVAVAAALFLAIGIAVSQSGAGYALFVPAALASFLIYRKASVGRVSRAWGIGVAVLFIGFVAVGVFGPLGKESLSDNFSEHPTSRSTIWEVTVKAATAFSPVGSGLGSFSGAYRTFDDPDRAGNQFVNHAHNDYLEIALELGVPGLLLVAAFLLWFGIRAVRVWSDDFRGATLGRLGSVIIAVVLIHSFVDYPLRTAAIQALFAMACAFLVPPPNRRKQARDQTSEGSELRHLEAD